MILGIDEVGRGPYAGTTGNWRLIFCRMRKIEEEPEKISLDIRTDMIQRS